VREAPVSVRREIYDLLSQLPDRDPVQRIVGLSMYLDSLPPNEVETAERRILALTKAYDMLVRTEMKGTLDEFFEMVDAIERSLVN
jgi:hypothetical protein